MSLNIPSLEQIKRALHLQEMITAMQAELSSIFGGAGGTGAKPGRKPGRKAGAEPLVFSGDEAATMPATTKRGRKPAKKKRVMSPEAREKIAAAQRKRWAKQKKAGK